MQLVEKPLSQAVTSKRKLPVTQKTQDGTAKIPNVTGNTGSCRLIAHARQFRLVYIMW